MKMPGGRIYPAGRTMNGLGESIKAIAGHVNLVLRTVKMPGDRIHLSARRINPSGRTVKVLARRIHSIA
jgi:hypothetical protein